MARPLFSDMLFDRRRQLGLSIKQASNVLRLKEEVLIAFEEGDFDSIPKSGYAQGMLSSYARYLGLNAKTVVNQFSQDLFEHERGAGSHEARRNRRRMSRGGDGPLYETPQAAAPGQGGSRRTYVESRGFLPTSGGFAGDMGDFATTSPARPRYRTQTSSDGGGDDAYPQGRPYTARVPYAGGMTPLGQVQRQRGRTRAEASQGYDGYGSYGGTMRAYDARDQVTTRRVSPAQYRDDMRLDNDGGGYQTASSTAGRRSSRNIANTQRPNVSRRTSRTVREQLGRRERAQGPAGVLGTLASALSDRGGLIALIIAVLVILLTATIVLSARSCINARQASGGSVQVTSADTASEDGADESSLTEEEEREARERAAAEKAKETQTAATERTITVSVAEGEVTWLEVECDGKSDIAETVTGPWEQTYVVRQSISINVNDTTAVTVTEDGRKLEFDAKASGIGTITLQVASSAAATGDGQTSSDAGQAQTSQGGDAAQGTTSGDQAGTAQGTQQPVQSGDDQAATPEAGQQQGYDATGTQTTAQQQGGSSPFEGYTLDADGYYYGADGYYDANGNFYQY